MVFVTVHSIQWFQFTKELRKIGFIQNILDFFTSHLNGKNFPIHLTNEWHILCTTGQKNWSSNVNSSAQTDQMSSCQVRTLTEPNAELRGECVTATAAVIAPVSFLLLLANCHAYFLCWVTAATQLTAWWITNPERESTRSAWIKTSLSFSFCLAKMFVHHRASPVLAEARGRFVCAVTFRSH